MQCFVELSKFSKLVCVHIPALAIVVIFAVECRFLLEYSVGGQLVAAKRSFVYWVERSGRCKLHDGRWCLLPSVCECVMCL